MIILILINLVFMYMIGMMAYSSGKESGYHKGYLDAIEEVRTQFRLNK